MARRDSTGPWSGSSTGRVGAPAEPVRTELPVLDVGVVRERADAARNRQRVLAAAARLFAERGVAAVTMDDVVAAAGVGKGTLFRRFGDKVGLAAALLDQRERDLQQAILSGPPPLGPGAPPVERLAAFVTAYVGYVAAQPDLVLMSETAKPGARLRTGAHGFWRQHLRWLLQSAGASDAGLRADLLLAGLAAEQVQHWLADDPLSPVDLAHRLAAAAERLAAPG
jgi:AcrR family transcriptional regulator